MAAKDEVDLFKAIYDGEWDRAKSLTTTGNIYITLIGVFLGYLGYKSTDTQFGRLLNVQIADKRVGLYLYLTVFGLLVAALAFAFSALVMRRYQRIADPSVIMDRIDTEGLTGSQVLDVFEETLTGAANNNWAVNNRRGRKLLIASILMFFAFFAYAAAFIWLNFQPPPPDMAPG